MSLRIRAKDGGRLELGDRSSNLRTEDRPNFGELCTSIPNRRGEQGYTYCEWVSALV